MTNEHAWSEFANAYQATRRISSEVVHYGPNGPSERELHLLPSVEGVRVLDLGCGGGQNSVALARQGANVVAVDFSETQLRYARKLASSHDVAIDFRRLDPETCNWSELGSFHLVLACFSIEYLSDLPRVCAAIGSSLTRDGVFVLCDLHPFVSSSDVVAVTPSQLLNTADYFRVSTREFSWGGHRFVRYHRTLQAYVDAFTAGGLQVKRIVEPDIDDVERPPASAAYMDKTISDQMAVWSHFPYTIIFVCERSDRV